MSAHSIGAPIDPYRCTATRRLCSTLYPWLWCTFSMAILLLGHSNSSLASLSCDLGSWGLFELLYFALQKEFRPWSYNGILQTARTLTLLVLCICGEFYRRDRYFTSDADLERQPLLFRRERELLLLNQIRKSTPCTVEMSKNPRAGSPISKNLGSSFQFFGHPGTAPAKRALEL